MSLEAAAGKNPVTHVGKIYSVVAKDIAERLVGGVSAIAKAQCLMVSEIGAPVTAPAMLQIKLATREGIPASDLHSDVEAIVADRLARIPALIDEFVAGTIAVY